jgi:alpha-glucosidase (family GH31 glycosyl hydrolase)
LAFSIAIGNSEFNKGRRNNDDKQGYVPLKNFWKKPIAADSTYKKYEIDSVKINIFKSFIKDCNDNNIKLFVICSPYFINFKYIDTSMNLAKEITKQMKVPFYDFSNTNTFSNNADLFSDIIHLNFKGSRIYTDMVIDKMIENQHKNPLMKESNSSSIIYSMIKQ